MKTDLAETLNYSRDLSRKLNSPLKILKCDQTPAGLSFYYLSPEKTDLRSFRRELNRRFKIRINLVPLPDQEGAAFIPGYGPCGVRLCWASDSCENLWPCKFKEALPAPETASPVPAEESAPISIPPISENRRRENHPQKKFIRRLILK